MLTLDSSGIIAAADTRDPFNQVVASLLAAEGPLVVPLGILAETTFMLRRRLGRVAERAFLDGLIEGVPLIDPDARLPRVVALMDRYGDLGLDFADATVVACAEEHGGRILTLDRRDFDVIAREEGSIVPVP